MAGALAISRRARTSLPEHDVAQRGRRRAVRARGGVDRHAAACERGDAGPQPPPLVERALGRARWGRGRRGRPGRFARRGLQGELRARLLILLGLALGLELGDQLLDLLAVRRLAREREVLAVAE